MEGPLGGCRGSPRSVRHSAEGPGWWKMIKSEMVFWTVCDRCGREYEGMEEGCGSSPQRALELADSWDWAEINGRHLCSVSYTHLTLPTNREV